jgi:hypothetical protein
MKDPTSTDDRLKIILDQLGAAWEMLDARLSERRAFRDEAGSTTSTLTDDEYFWEPVAGCWSLRRRGEAKGVGKGEWVLEGQHPEPDPPPFTTIAWRICHVTSGILLRYDWTFGTHSLTVDDVEFPSTAAGGVTFLREHYSRWRSALETVTTEELDQIGRSQFPHGLDRRVRFVDLLGWVNLDFAHHAAEIGCLRDLYRHSASAEGSPVSTQ